MTDKPINRKCAVCGDKGTGYNFNAMTCVSCKAFFRRNALKNQENKCHFIEKCEINTITRRFCPKCRLNKCFAVGMKKESILSDEEKQLRKIKIKKNRIKFMESTESENIIDSTTGEVTEPIILNTNANYLTDFLEQVLEDNNISEEKIKEQIMEIESSITYKDNTSDISHDVSEKAVELEFAVMPVNRPISDYNNNFNELEFNRLTELLNATNAVKMTFGGETVEADTYHEAICAIFDNFEQVLVKLINMSKRLSLFNQVCENDQIALIKYGSIEMVCMRAVIGYDCRTEYLTFPDEETSSSVVVRLEALREEKVVLDEANRTYYRHIGKEWDSDSVLLDLMTAIVLFNPNRPHLMHRDTVKLQQHIYMYLLQRYLLLRYRSESEAISKFLKLINTLKHLHRLYLSYIDFYAEERTDQSDCGGLIDEICCLQI